MKSLSMRCGWRREIRERFGEVFGGECDEDWGAGRVIGVWPRRFGRGGSVNWVGCETGYLASAITASRMFMLGEARFIDQAVKYRSVGRVGVLLAFWRGAKRKRAGGPLVVVVGRGGQWKVKWGKAVGVECSVVRGRGGGES